MKIITFILSFFCVFLISAQNDLDLDCYVKKKRSMKIMKKLNQNLRHYSFSDVKNLLSDIESKEGSSAQIYDMYALIYWLKDDIFRAREYANKSLALCSDNFSTSNYIIGMIHYDLRDWQICVDYIEKATEIGLKTRLNSRNYQEWTAEMDSPGPTMAVSTLES